MEETTKGYWIIEQDDNWLGGEVCWCSECEYGFATALNFEPFYWKYCPRCGKEMDVPPLEDR